MPHERGAGNGGLHGPDDGGQTDETQFNLPAGLSEADVTLWQAFERLNAREQRYLRLSAQGYTSKEIALSEDGHEQSISKVIERARSKCGGIFRRDLSRKYAEWEQWRNRATTAHSTPTAVSEKIDGESLPVANGAPALPDDASVLRADVSNHEEPAVPEPSGLPQSSVQIRLPVGIIGSTRNELDRIPRLVAILLIALAGALTASASLSLLFILDHLASSR